MDKEDIIIEMIKDFKNENDKNFDKLEKEINEIKDNHIKHIYDKLNRLELDLKNEISEIRTELKGETGEIRAELKGGTSEIRAELRELKGNFDIIKPIGLTIAGGVVLAVIKYLFFS